MASLFKLFILFTLSTSMSLAVQTESNQSEIQQSSATQKKDSAAKKTGRPAQPGERTNNNTGQSSKKSTDNNSQRGASAQTPNQPPTNKCPEGAKGCIGTPIGPPRMPAKTNTKKPQGSVQPQQEKK